MQKTTHDIIIVGAGIVGLVLARALAQSSLRVALLERESLTIEIPADFDLRVSAISRASENVLRALDIWEPITTMRVSPYRAMDVWDKQGSGAIHFAASEMGEANLGYIIENNVIRKALLDALNLNDNIEIFCPCELSKIETDSHKTTVSCRDGKQLSAKLLVGADGAHSVLRELTGIAIDKHDYGQHALVTMVTTELEHKQTARQCFSDKGILAFLPLSKPHLSSIVWSGTSAEIKNISQLSPKAFELELLHASDERLGKVSVHEYPKPIFPLSRQHAHHYVQSRIALIGDAAHTVHPLAGQGVNLGILDAACLAEVIIAAQEEGKDLGSLPVLRQYERWRRGHNLATMYAMDIFKEAFGSEWQPLIWLRNQALRFANQAKFIKYYFAKQALGISGDLPKLARRPNDNA